MGRLHDNRFPTSDSDTPSNRDYMSSRLTPRERSNKDRASNNYNTQRERDEISLQAGIDAISWMIKRVTLLRRDKELELDRLKESS